MNSALLSFCFLFLTFMLKAQEIVSPSGKFKLDFSLNAQGTPVYQLTYKGKVIIKPSKLGLELTANPK